MKTSELPSHVTCKKAMVYVRQSSAQQVQENLESQRRQYNLVELAKSYGFSEVEVIDEDLGLTASGKVERPGFNRLVSQLCAGQVGAVLCLEASRIARNGRDWHHLLELCGLVNARVIDSDGVYNPTSPNDRLLLGMKGTISEFELGIIRTRMLEASWSKAQRGELRIAVPIGYVWHSEASVDFDPDLRIQEMIHLVFERFFILGSARKVLLSMKAEGLHFPRPSDGKLTTSFYWQPPNYRNIISILNNPFYAGVYAYGKSEVQTEIVDGYARKSYGRRKPMEEWKIFIKDHHKGYIVYDKFEEIQEKLARNAFSKKDGKSKPGRGGRALLSGLLRYGICGRKLKVVYTGRYPGLPRYRCERGNVSLGLPYCIAFGGTRVDRVIAHEILTVVQPMAIEAAMEVEKRKADSRKERRKIHELELEQARYNAQLAERRYAACDPSNRLVAAQLEARWEDAIQQVKSCELRLILLC